MDQEVLLRVNRLVPGGLPATDLQGLWQHAKENRPTTVVGWLTWATVGLAGTTVCSAACAAAFGFLFFICLGVIGFISIASVVIGTWLSISAFLGFFALLGLGSLTLSAALAQMVVNTVLKYVPILYASVYNQLNALEIQSYVHKHILPNLKNTDKPQSATPAPAGSIQQAADPAPAQSQAAHAYAVPNPPTPGSTASDSSASTFKGDGKHVTIAEPVAVSTLPPSMMHTAARNVDISNGSFDQLRPVKERVM